MQPIDYSFNTEILHIYNILTYNNLLISDYFQFPQMTRIYLYLVGVTVMLSTFIVTPASAECGDNPMAKVLMVAKKSGMA